MATGNKDAGTTGAKRRFRLYMMFIVLFMGWASYVFFGQMQQKNATGLKLSAIEEQMDATTKQSEELKREIERLNDPEYIEQLATKEQGMVKEGEQQIFAD